MVQEQNGWKGVTVQVWASAPERTQDFLQVLYKCCGFIKGDTLAYTGHSFLYENSTTKVGDIGLNQCTPGANPPPSTYDGSTLVIRAAITFSVLFLVLAITIPAANRARKSPKQYGKIVTEPSIIQGQGPYQKF
ncbi:hypothetical protein HK099_005467 [Clydaea vesicula]|uniref:Uncharacterized protein n=1 Tax=Clydaea vesicula TaxID=447962 RepID=A0AAD5U112_9FUNG|nr:hypothetical protein HK099_005467 [Clydaea vesicula]